MLLNKKILWNDCETGGTEPKIDAPLQLSAIIEMDGKVVDSIDLKMKPYGRKRVTQKALEVQGRTLEEVMSFEEPKRCFERFYEFLKKEPKSKAARFMPRWAARLHLSVVSVREERLQDISKKDAIAEGIKWAGMYWHDYRKGEMKQSMLQDPVDSFRTLWDSINEKRGFGWNVNPWVWKIEFKLI